MRMKTKQKKKNFSSSALSNIFVETWKMKIFCFRYLLGQWNFIKFKVMNAFRLFSFFAFHIINFNLVTNHHNSQLSFFFSSVILNDIIYRGMSTFFLSFFFNFLLCIDSAFLLFLTNPLTERAIPKSHRFEMMQVNPDK